jgi:hypothetical protein
MESLVYQYITSFPNFWEKRIHFLWTPRSEDLGQKVTFAISPILHKPWSNEDKDFVTECLQRHFTIVKSKPNFYSLLFENISFDVVLLHEKILKLGTYFIYRNQRCNIKQFVNKYIHPFCFKQPKKFICLTRKS